MVFRYYSFAMDHGYLLTILIHFVKIPTSPQNFANTTKKIFWYDLRLGPKPILTLSYLDSIVPNLKKCSPA